MKLFLLVMLLSVSAYSATLSAKAEGNFIRYTVVFKPFERGKFYLYYCPDLVSGKWVKGELISRRKPSVLRPFVELEFVKLVNSEDER
jgi:hypothetical protein